jgi:hypothetical protein
MVKVKSPEEVIQVLRQLVKDKKRQREIGARAKAYVTEHFTGAQYVAAMKQLIEQRDNADNPNARIAKALRTGQVKTALQLMQLHKKGKA